MSLGDLPASRETGGPLTLQRLQSDGETDRLSLNNHTSQDELAFMIEARAEMGLCLDWQVREGFLGVMLLQLRSEGNVSEREGRASVREQGMGAPKVGGARDLEGLPR